MRAWLAVVLVVPALARADVLTLDRNADDYFILAERSATLKNIHVEGCNVGINCTQPGNSNLCGLLHARGATVDPPGQIAADSMCASQSFFEVFKNGPALCGPSCAQIGHAVSNPDCTAPLVTPILGDLDGDGTPSCDVGCLIDRGDLAVACGVTLPFAPCNPAAPVEVQMDGDCSIGDTMPGNHRCDLATGIYGRIQVRDGARIDFGAGTTIACTLEAGKSTRVTSSGVATVVIPGKGKVRLSDFADVGGMCGQLSVVTEAGRIQFGKFGDYLLDACTVGGKIRLGHGNNLQGHFRGDTLASDANNDGRCCVASTCGNGVIDPSEDCDGSAPNGDAACPGLCTLPHAAGECTCGPPPTTTSTTITSTSTTATTLATTTTTTTSSSSTTSTAVLPPVTTTTTSVTSTTEPGTTTSTIGATTTTSTAAPTTTTSTSDPNTTTTTSTTTSTTSTTTTTTTTTSTTTSTSTSTTATTLAGPTTTTTTTSTTTTSSPSTSTTTSTTTTTTSSTTVTTSTATSTTTTTTAPPPTTSTTTSTLPPVTTTTSSTTTTTLPHGAWTRTAGFYKNHPTITQNILTGVGGFSVCGGPITDVDVNHGHSALEALCVSAGGRLQLARQLVTAALSMSGGGAVFADFSRCDAICANPNAASGDVAGCIDETDGYNNSGDNLTAPFDPPGAASPSACKQAQGTACTVIQRSVCAAP